MESRIKNIVEEGVDNSKSLKKKYESLLEKWNAFDNESDETVKQELYEGFVKDYFNTTTQYLNGGKSPIELPDTLEKVYDAVLISRDLKDVENILNGYLNNKKASEKYINGYFKSAKKAANVLANESTFKTKEDAIEWLTQAAEKYKEYIPVDEVAQIYSDNRDTVSKDELEEILQEEFDKRKIKAESYVQIKS